MRIRAIVPWFGGARMLAESVGGLLRGCSWVGIPFVGGFSEVSEITARTILCNDLHRHVINLARVIADDELRPKFLRTLKRRSFHPDELAKAQQRCKEWEHSKALNPIGVLDWASDYFVCSWMGRSSKAGLESEFNGRPAVRWTSDGGDSMVRYQSALRSIAEWSRILRRCTFETMDAFEFLARCEDRAGHGIYCDPPFPGLGRGYRHNCGQTDAEERAWHVRLMAALERFQKCTIVCRFYRHPLIDELYPTDAWDWLALNGRKQTNEGAAELLVSRRVHACKKTPLMFT